MDVKLSPNIFMNFFIWTKYKDINDISLEIRKLVKNGFKIKEKVDYNLLNKQRIEKIEKIMENRND